METMVSGGQAMAAAAMPILLVVLLVLVGFTMVVLGQGWAHVEVRSRSVAAIGSLCLVGAFPASKATAGIAAGVLLGTGTAVGVAVLATIAGLFVLARSS